MKYHFIIKYIYLFLLVILFTACKSKEYSVPYHKDGSFVNLYNHQSKSFFEYFMMRIKTSEEDWPEQVALKNQNIKPQPFSEDLKIYYINHSTFLIQIDNINILTDPIFSERASPVSFAGPKRVILPGIKKSDLPKIDLIIISHNHYDHLDIDFLRWISKKDQPKILVGLGVGQIFEKENFQELAWWEETQFKNISLVFTPAQHFSGRSLWDKNETLWGSFILEMKGVTLYFAGDTGYGPHFKDIFQKFGEIDIALLPIGAYAPRYFMKYPHINPEEAIQAHKDLHSKNSLGMHWGTFQLTNESRLEPKYRLEELREKTSITSFFVPENGDCYIYKNNHLLFCKTPTNREN